MALHGRRGTRGWDGLRRPGKLECEASGLLWSERIEGPTPLWVKDWRFTAWGRATPAPASLLHGEGASVPRSADAAGALACGFRPKPASSRHGLNRKRPGRPGLPYSAGPASVAALIAGFETAPERDPNAHLLLERARATPSRASAIRDVLGPSQWLDLAGGHTEDKWSDAEGPWSRHAAPPLRCRVAGPRPPRD